MYQTRPFFSYETKSIINGKFQLIGNSGELEIYRRQGWNEHNPVYVKSPDGTLVQARSSQHQFEKFREMWPTTWEELSNIVKEMANEAVKFERVIPSDAKYFGVDEALIEKSRKDYEERCRKRHEEREAREAARTQQEAEQDAKRWEKIRDQISKDEQIHGEDLEYAAKKLRVDVHPRTLGTLRSRVSAINSGTARVSKTRSGSWECPTAIYVLYRECRKLIAENELTPT